MSRLTSLPAPCSLPVSLRLFTAMRGRHCLLAVPLPSPARDHGLNPCVMVPGFGPLMGGQTCQWAAGSRERRGALASTCVPFGVTAPAVLGAQWGSTSSPSAKGSRARAAPCLQGWPCHLQGLVACSGPCSRASGRGSLPAFSLRPWGPRGHGLGRTLVLPAGSKPLSPGIAAPPTHPPSSLSPRPDRAGPCPAALNEPTQENSQAHILHSLPFKGTRMGPACPTAQGRLTARPCPTAERSLVVAEWAQLPTACRHGPARLCWSPQGVGQSPQQQRSP